MQLDVLGPQHTHVIVDPVHGGFISSILSRNFLFVGI